MKTFQLSNCTYQPKKGRYELFGGGYKLVLRKTGRMKGIFLTILIFIIVGCDQNQTIRLDEDPIVNEIFNKEEVKGLQKILVFFETQISDSTNQLDINEVYKEFFTKLRFLLEHDENDINISSQEQKIFFEKLDSSLFNKIWYYENNYVPHLKDTVESIHYKWASKYFDFVALVSEKDDLFEEYFQLLTSFGDCSPYIVCDVMLINSDKYNLKHERNRLIIAISYLTLNELLILSENQNDK